MSEASAAQYYYDPPDPIEYTWAVTIELDVTATTSDEAYELITKVMNQGPMFVNDWFVDDMHPYGPEVDDRPD